MPCDELTEQKKSRDIQNRKLLEEHLGIPNQLYPEIHSEFQIQAIDHPTSPNSTRAIIWNIA